MLTVVVAKWVWEPVRSLVGIPVSLSVSDVKERVGLSLSGIDAVALLAVDALAV